MALVAFWKIGLRLLDFRIWEHGGGRNVGKIAGYKGEGQDGVSGIHNINITCQN